MNYKNGSYKEGTGIFQDGPLVAFVTNDKKEVTFIEGLNRVAQVCPELVERVYQHLKGVRKMSDGEYEEALGEIGAMLQRCVKYWKRSDKECAEYYIDAYQCVQENIKTIKNELQIFIPQSSKGSVKQ